MHGLETLAVLNDRAKRKARIAELRLVIKDNLRRIQNAFSPDDMENFAHFALEAFEELEQLNVFG